MDNPKVTVLMPVYNGEEFLKEAIESILKQTYSDFEFLIIDDGSKDNSKEIIQSYKDSRIKLIINDENLGLPKTLNKGINLSKGKYIVRMDCDDFSLPDRIRLQVDFMEDNLDIGICGSRYIDYKSGKIIKLPTDPDIIKIRLLFHCPINHPSVIMRKSLIIENNLFYNENKIGDLEDYELWLRASDYTNIANLETPLIKYRIHESQLTNINKNSIEKGTNKEIIKQLEKLGITPSKDEWKIHEKLKNFLPSEYTKGRRSFPKDIIQYKNEVDNWFNKILECNNKVEIYNQNSLRNVFKQYLNEFNNVEEDFLKSLLNINSNRSLYIWGTGEYGKSFLNYLIINGLKVKGFVDNSKNKWGKSLEGIEVFSPNQLIDKRRLDENPFIVIASMYFKEISEDLEIIGFRKELDYIDRILY